MGRLVKKDVEGRQPGQKRLGFCAVSVLLVLYIGSVSQSLATESVELIRVWTAPALVKIFAKEKEQPSSGAALRLQACRNEVEWGQIVFRATERLLLELEASDLISAAGQRLAARQISFHPAVYVRVRLPSGNRVNTPAEWPEILPQAKTIELLPGRNQPVYVQLRVPATAAPGNYGGEIRWHVYTLRSHNRPNNQKAGITAGETRAGGRVPLRVQIWPLTLPEVPTTHASYYVWWDGISQRFGLQKKPRERQRIFDRFFQFLLEHRICPMILPVDLRQAARYMRDPRVNAVRIPYDDNEAYLREIIALVKQRGWLERCYFYLLDEPPRRLWDEVRRVGFKLASIEPEMGRLDTIQPERELENAVTVWCPNIESIYLYEAQIAEIVQRQSEASERQEGDGKGAERGLRGVWWYTCVFPKYPYPTFLLDDDAIAPRLLFWAEPRYGLTGSLYINTIHWGPEGHDPWAEAVVDPTLRNNNDGLLIYTGRGRTLQDAYPVTGVRLEMIRDGLEDVELCHLLEREITALAGRERARRHLAALASQILPDLRHPERDPAALLALREWLVEEILALPAKPSRIPDFLSLPLRTILDPAGIVGEDKFAVALRGTPRIDGRLDDPCWEAARVANAPGSRTIITRFRNLTGRIWPSQETSVLCLYDADNLYFGFRCQEPDIAHLAPLAETSDLARADRVAVGLWANGREHWVIVTLEGRLFEGSSLEHPQEPRVRAWEAKTHMLPDGYAAEICVPRAFVAGEPRVLFNLFRYAAPGQETLYFVGRHSHRQSPFQFGTLELR